MLSNVFQYVDKAYPSEYLENTFKYFSLNIVTNN